MFAVVGLTTVDFFASGFDKAPHFGGDEFDVDNLTYCREPLKMVLGGNGGNSAFALGNLGANVRLSSIVGSDQAGKLAMEWLADKGVDLRALIRSQTAATATNNVITDGALNRLSFFHLGAAESFSYHDIPQDFLTSAQILLIAGYPLFPGLRPDGYQSLLASARSRGITTAIDIGPAIGKLVKLSELLPILPNVDYLIGNDYELTVCTEHEDCTQSAAAILKAGVQAVVIKQDKDGATIISDQGQVHHPAFAVEARFTVGAGDSFNAGLLYCIANGWPIGEALRFANATAALSISSGEGILGAPTVEQVEVLIQS